MLDSEMSLIPDRPADAAPTPAREVTLRNRLKQRLSVMAVLLAAAGGLAIVSPAVASADSWEWYPFGDGNYLLCAVDSAGHWYYCEHWQIP
jgi:hypothetical protein